MLCATVCVFLLFNVYWFFKRCLLTFFFFFFWSVIFWSLFTCLCLLVYLSTVGAKGLVEGGNSVVQPTKDFALHQMDHMKAALGEGGEWKEGSFGFKDIIPDGQTNEFKTKAGVVSDWAVSGDAPEWIVAQARRSGVNSVLVRANDFKPDDGQINEFNVGENVKGMASDW